MATMIEKVREAMKARLESGSAIVGAGVNIGSFEEKHAQVAGEFNLDELARAAVEAMREPTDEMLLAMSDFDLLGDDKAQWRTAIDAALAEGTK